MNFIDPSPQEREHIRSELLKQGVDLTVEWGKHWREREGSVNILEHYQEFWNLQRERIKKE